MIDLKGHLKTINLKNHIPIDNQKIINQDGKIMVHTCPICHKHGHFWVSGPKYGSYNGCCNGGDLWDWFQEYEGLDKKASRKKCIEVLGISDSQGKSFKNFLESDRKMDQLYENMIVDTIENMYFRLHQMARLMIILNRHKNIYSRLIKLLTDKKNKQEKYHFCLLIDQNLNI
jgi:hypothetical protein